MTVIGFINQKGGCGKSTAAFHLAWWLYDKGHSIFIIDADAQQSTSRWLKNMESPIPCEAIQDPSELIDKIPQRAKEYEYVVVDGAGGLTESTRCIVLRSDVVIVPVKPTGMDLTSGEDAIKSVTQAQSIRGGKPSLYIFLSMAEKGTRLRREAREYFNDAPLLESIIHQSQTIADCFGQGAVVWTMPTSKGAKAARLDFNAFCTEVMSKITPAKQGVVANG